MAVAYKSSDRTLGIPDFYVSNDATQQFELGRIASGQDVATASPYGDAEFMYVKFTGSTNIAAGDFVLVNRYAKTGTGSGTGGAPGASKTTFYGIAMAAQTLATATPTYGWVMIRGVHDAAYVASGGGAYVGGTLGGLATPVGSFTYVQTANFLIDGTVLRAAGTGAHDAVVEILYPYCSGR